MQSRRQRDHGVMGNCNPFILNIFQFSFYFLIYFIKLIFLINSFKMKLFALAAGVLGVPIENDYVPAPMVIGGTQVNHWSTSHKEINNLDRINLPSRRS